MATPTFEIHSLDLEGLAVHAHRARDLVLGAAALLLGSPKLVAIDAARISILEAQAQLADICALIEGHLALNAEARRQTHAQALKHVGQEVGR